MRVVGPAVALCVALLLGPDLAAPAVGQTTPPPTLSVSADAPATPRGSVELSPTTGALVRVIPIEVPAYHAIEPRLALSYSSLSGNGFAGVGWALSGFSVIERTRNGRGTPRFTSSDVYVLDGQELLPCSQASSSPGCLAGGTHATKQESYSKIRALGRSTYSASARTPSNRSRRSSVVPGRHRHSVRYARAFLTTAIYADVAPEGLRRVVEKAHPRERSWKRRR